MKVGERRLTSVGSGFKTKNSRSRESARILNWGFRTFDTVKVATVNEPFESLDVWLGKKNKVAVVVKEDIYLTIPKRKKKIIKAVMEFNGPIQAPINKGDKVGILKVFISGDLKREVDILANEKIKRDNVFSRVFKSLNYLVWGDV